jgi:hypothetical protein
MEPLSKLRQAIEVTGTIDANGQLSLDQLLPQHKHSRVRVIVLLEESINHDDTPTELVLEGLRQGLQEALTGQTLPLSQLWDGIDAG